MNDDLFENCLGTSILHCTCIMHTLIFGMPTYIDSFVVLVHSPDFEKNKKNFLKPVNLLEVLKEFPFTAK